MQGAGHIMMNLDISIKCLVDRLLSQGYEVKCLRNSFKKFYGRYPDLIGKYQRSVKDMAAYSFPDSFNAVVQLVLSLSLFFEFYY